MGILQTALDMYRTRGTFHRQDRLIDLVAEDRATAEACATFERAAGGSVRAVSMLSATTGRWRGRITCAAVAAAVGASGLATTTTAPMVSKSVAATCDGAAATP